MSDQSTRIVLLREISGLRSGKKSLCDDRLREDSAAGRFPRSPHRRSARPGQRIAPAPGMSGAWQSRARGQRCETRPAQPLLQRSRVKRSSGYWSALRTRPRAPSWDGRSHPRVRPAGPGWGGGGGGCGGTAALSRPLPSRFAPRCSGTQRLRLDVRASPAPGAEPWSPAAQRGPGAPPAAPSQPRSSPGVGNLPRRSARLRSAAGGGNRFPAWPWVGSEPGRARSRTGPRAAAQSREPGAAAPTGGAKGPGAPHLAGSPGRGSPVPDSTAARRGGGGGTARCVSRGAGTDPTAVTVRTPAAARALRRERVVLPSVSLRGLSPRVILRTPRRTGHGAARPQQNRVCHRRRQPRPPGEWGRTGPWTGCSPSRERVPGEEPYGRRSSREAAGKSRAAARRCAAPAAGLEPDRPCPGLSRASTLVLIPAPSRAAPGRVSAPHFRCSARSRGSPRTARNEGGAGHAALGRLAETPSAHRKGSSGEREVRVTEGQI